VPRVNQDSLEIKAFQVQGVYQVKMAVKDQGVPQECQVKLDHEAHLVYKVQMVLREILVTRVKEAKLVQLDHRVMLAHRDHEDHLVHLVLMVPKERRVPRELKVILVQKVQSVYLEHLVQWVDPELQEMKVPAVLQVQRVSQEKKV